MVHLVADPRMLTGVIGAVDGATCDPSAGFICDAVLRITDSELAAEVIDVIFSKGLRLVLIAVLALLGVRIVNRSIKHLVDGMSRARLPRAAEAIWGKKTGPQVDAGPSLARTTQRGMIIGSVLHSAAVVVIWSMAALMMLSELGINLGPLIAGAGIAGVALGFGAQSLVRDFLVGLFILFEDQFALGDQIELAEVSGTVEGFTLRITKLRDQDGKIWYVPNGEIRRVGNRSQATSEMPPPEDETELG